MGQEHAIQSLIRRKLPVLILLLTIDAIYSICYVNILPTSGSGVSQHLNNVGHVLSNSIRHGHV